MNKIIEKYSQELLKKIINKKNGKYLICLLNENSKNFNIINLKIKKIMEKENLNKNNVIIINIEEKKIENEFLLVNYLNNNINIIKNL